MTLGHENRTWVMNDKMNYTSKSRKKEEDLEIQKYKTKENSIVVKEKEEGQVKI